MDVPIWGLVHQGGSDNGGLELTDHCAGHYSIDLDCASPCCICAGCTWPIALSILLIVLPTWCGMNGPPRYVGCTVMTLGSSVSGSIYTYRGMTTHSIQGLGLYLQEHAKT